MQEQFITERIILLVIQCGVYLSVINNLIICWGCSSANSSTGTGVVYITLNFPITFNQVYTGVAQCQEYNGSYWYHQTFSTNNSQISIRSYVSGNAGYVGYPSYIIIGC